jgi:hypothetical protein
MFRTKPISYNATITSKPPKTNNMPINVIVVTTRNQHPKQVFKKSIYGIHSLKILNNYNIVGLKISLLPSMKVHCRVIGPDYVIILPQLNWVKEIKSMK